MVSINKTSLYALCAALCEAAGVGAPKEAAASCKELTGYIKKLLTERMQTEFLESS